MSLAIQWGYTPVGYSNQLPVSQGFIYFDAVTAYRKTLSGSVTKNPIDSGGNISDHFTRENPVITISAVISGVDISVNGISIFDENGNTPQNTRERRDPVRVNSDDKSLLTLLPDSIGQFFTPQKPEVVLAAQPVDTLNQIQEVLESLFSQDEAQLVTLFEYFGNNLTKKPLQNLVMTSLVFNEDANTGEGLHCDITLERISFVSLKKTQIPKGIQSQLVAADLAKRAESQNSKGKVDSTPQDGIPPNLRKQEKVKSVAADITDGVVSKLERVSTR